MTRFCIAADAPVTSPAGVRTRNRRALSSIQAPNVQAPSSPFSPAHAKQPVKTALRLELSRTASSFPSEGNNVEVQLPPASFSLGDLSQKDDMIFHAEEKNSSKARTLAVLVAVAATIVCSSQMAAFTSSSSSMSIGRSGYSSIAHWRTAAAEEWRMSADAQRLDLTFEDMGATSSASYFDGDMMSWRQESISTWRGEAAEEWRQASESKSLRDSQEPSPLLKWSAVGGIGAWREFAANRWRASDQAAEMEMNIAEADASERAFTLDTAPFSVSFFPQQKRPVFEWGSGVIA